MTLSGLAGDGMGKIQQGLVPVGDMEGLDHSTGGGRDLPRVWSLPTLATPYPQPCRGGPLREVKGNNVRTAFGPGSVRGPSAHKGQPRQGFYDPVRPVRGL